MAYHDGDGTVFPERREFFRIFFDKPLEFKSYSLEKEKNEEDRKIAQGACQNISSSGILFQIEKNPPPLSSILWMNLDARTLNICQEIEKRALLFNDGLLGRVVRVEENAKNNGVYDIGICFLTQDEKHQREILRFLSKLA